MSGIQLYQTSSGIADLLGNVTIKFPAPGFNRTWQGTVSVLGSPQGTQWTVAIGSLNFGMLNAPGPAGPYQLLTSQQVMLTAAGLTPGAQCNAILSGVDDPKDEASPYTGPTIVTSVVGFVKPVTANPFFTVQGYGAVGDGVTDDTVDIQAALTAAGTGGDVYVPYTSAGYLCGALSIPSGVRLIFAQSAYFTAVASLTASWIVAQPGVSHTGTAVVNGRFIASAITSPACTAVIDFAQVISCAGAQIYNNVILDAPVHGIFMKELSLFTLYPKWISNNGINAFGRVATGFAIYTDYVGSVSIDNNFINGNNTSDGIENGHAGARFLGGLNATNRCTNNTVWNSDIQFPFCDGLIIANNTLLGDSMIQNDANTANDVVITGNTVLVANPSAGFGGIGCCGDSATITGNYVSILATAAGVGIGGSGGGGSMTNSLVANNTVATLYIGGAPSQVGIEAGQGTATTYPNNTVENNTIIGAWQYGIGVSASGTVVRGNKVSPTTDGTAPTNVPSVGIFVFGSSGLGYILSGLTIENNDVSRATTSLTIQNLGQIPTLPWVVRNNKGYNPVGSAVPNSAFAIGATTVAATNNSGVDLTLYVTAAGTVTAVSVNGVVISGTLAVGDTYRLVIGGTLKLTYSAPPTLVPVGD